MVNTVDLKRIKEYKKTFESEKKQFKNVSYSTFSNSYIKKSSDPYIQRMSSNLDKMYLNINSAYSTIKNWWDKYIESLEGVERKIKNTSPLSKNIEKIKEDFLKNTKGEAISNAFGEMKNELTKKFENFNKIAAENPELADAINTIMREHPEYDFESYCEKCMNDPSFANNVMTAADNINKQKAAEKYAEEHPIKSSKAYKSVGNFFNGVKEVYFDTSSNLFGMGLVVANGVETGFKRVEGTWNYLFYSTGLLDAKDYVDLQMDKKKNEWFNDDVVNDFINNDTTLNDTKYSKTVTNILGGIGEQALPLMIASLFRTPQAGAIGGAISGIGEGADNSFEHQKEAMDGIPIELSIDEKNETVTYLYEGNKVVIDSTGNIISCIKMNESEYNKILSEYISKDDISKGALLQGAWGAVSWGTGMKLAGAVLCAKPFINSAAKIGIDASMGGAETPIQALIQSTYAQFYVDENGKKVYYDKDTSYGEKFKNSFKEKGGWKSVAEGAAMAAAMSTVGEAGDLSAKMKTQKEYKTMIDENPNAAAKKLTEFGFTEQEAIDALNKYSTKELAEKAAKLEEFSMNNNKKAFDSEFKKMKENINDNNLDFFKADDLDVKSNKAKKTFENITENAKKILNDNSGKFNIDAFKEKFKGKSDKANIDIDGIRKDYNIILNKEAEIDINIRTSIDYTLRKNGITPTKELIDKYYLEIQKGNYSVVTRDGGWRQYVEDAVNYKNSIQSQKIEYKKILDGLEKGKNGSYSNEIFSNPDIKSLETEISNIDSYLEKIYNNPSYSSEFKYYSSLKNNYSYYLYELKKNELSILYDNNISKFAKIYEKMGYDSSKISDLLNNSSKEVAIERANQIINFIDGKSWESNLKFAEYNGDLRAFIMENMPSGLSESEKAYYIYRKLNKELSYSTSFLNENIQYSSLKSDIYNKKINIESFNNEEIVCSNWAQMYGELLAAEGIKYKIVGGQKVGNHKYIFFEADGKYYYADAFLTREEFNSDVYNSQTNNKTNCFFQISKEQYDNNVRMSELLKDINEIKNNPNSSRAIEVQNMDRKLGYDTSGIEDMFNVDEKSISNYKGSEYYTVKTKLISDMFEKNVIPKIKNMGVIEGNKLFNSLDQNYRFEIWTGRYINKFDGSFCTCYSLPNGNKYVHFGKEKFYLLSGNMKTFFEQTYEKTY